MPVFLNGLKKQAGFLDAAKTLGSNVAKFAKTPGAQSAMKSTALKGAGLGAASGAVSGALSKDENGKRGGVGGALKGAAIGGTLGGVSGAAAPLAQKAVNGVKAMNRGAKISSLPSPTPGVAKTAGYKNLARARMG